MPRGMLTLTFGLSIKFVLSESSLKRLPSGSFFGILSSFVCKVLRSMGVI